MPNFYKRSTEAEKALGVQKGEMPRSVKKHNHLVPIPFHEKNGTDGHGLQDLERRYSDSIEETDFEEVWFAGCHTGTYVLRWIDISNIRTIP